MEGVGGSPGSDLSVVPDDVPAVGRYAYEMAQNLKSALESAGHDVDSLTSGGWRSGAADSYAAGWKECFDGGTRIFDALTQMADKLGVNADNYRRRDDSSASSFTGLNMGGAASRPERSRSIWITSTRR
ncbi:WXG100 family type VII secretion target [Antrihabitans cavernicola]|uniref:WXG100 family type VII secretion target n=1 Tax=Antrihabitans cavernicola TaxID=2495913 RepID=A0A5A7SHY9_9NOCA|nr:WXG100 family type VII secretion target [Spelaeibacter cavernicola]KAA0024979.1 WXG100 family type VII secretion target [Spelaeibacter cavernicola]